MSSAAIPREDVLMALEPWVQVPAGVAELAQLLACSSRPPTVLLGPINLLGRIRRAWRWRRHQLRLALQVPGKSRVPLPILRQGGR